MKLRGYKRLVVVGYGLRVQRREHARQIGLGDQHLTGL
jgi:hypothetical protein